MIKCQYYTSFIIVRRFQTFELPAPPRQDRIESREIEGRLSIAHLLFSAASPRCTSCSCTNTPRCCSLRLLSLVATMTNAALGIGVRACLSVSPFLSPFVAAWPPTTLCHAQRPQSHSRRSLAHRRDESPSNARSSGIGSSRLAGLRRSRSCLGLLGDS